ncbi:MAG TPA: DUF2058 domain-containing protein [Gammaproteobacteria bacterium]|jgi:hypothetical protein|nr:nucleoprotein/polynucleotide-associated enzyme [Chromatiales bacterium]MCP4925203.1 DUF2058 domain-containing protein [Gammaproteobacteria bacterium]MDP6098480.1 DUF2058 domain-containing protein [Gammaproteobacteria bacterium]HJP38996.1 DUF2058 domain-containing protein [Gammaproteobacteria bacterium]
MSSLQEQLLKTGVVDKKKAKYIEQEKRKQKKKTPKGQAQLNEATEEAIANREERVARDRELSRQLNEKAERKAVAAQIKQLIEVNRVDRNDGEISYQFTDGKKINKIYVTALLQTQLSNGLIAIVKLGDQYELVPSPVAEKIAQRDESRIILQNLASKDSGNEDDSYADYQIPDDLMW